MKEAKLFIGAVGIVTAVFLSSCGKDQSFEEGPIRSSYENPKAAIRSLIEDIPKLDVKEASSSDSIIPGSERDYKTTINGEPRYVHHEERESVSTFEQLVAFDPNSDVMWPGAVVQGRTLQTGILTPVPLKHSEAPITITNLTMNSGARYSTVVKRPTHANVTQAIQTLLTQDKKVESAAKATFTLKSFRTLEEGLQQVGISADWIGGEARASLKSGKYSENNNFIVRFTQNYYTASYETPETPEAIFDSEVSYSDAQLYMYSAVPALKRVNNPPVYISSVSYGRTMLFIFSSKTDKETMEATLEASFNGASMGGSISLKGEESNLFQSFDTKVLVLGGGGNAMTALLTGDKLRSINEFIQQGASFSEKSPGVPISYTARYLKDFDVAKINFTTRYEVNTSIPIPIKKMNLVFQTQNDDKDREEEVEVWLTKNSKVLYHGSFGKGQIWGDNTRQQMEIVLRAELSGANECNGVQLRIRKNPYGSDSGCGWRMAPELNVFTEAGDTFQAIRGNDSLVQSWGDGSEYDRTFTLKCN